VAAAVEQAVPVEMEIQVLGLVEQEFLPQFPVLL
jgi:hypothetical protein